MAHWARIDATIDALEAFGGNNFATALATFPISVNAPYIETIFAQYYAIVGVMGTCHVECNGFIKTSTVASKLRTFVNDLDMHWIIGHCLKHIHMMVSIEVQLTLPIAINICTWNWEFIHVHGGHFADHLADVWNLKYAVNHSVGLII